jgi:hypothetical protein
MISSHSVLTAKFGFLRFYGQSDSPSLVKGSFLMLNQSILPVVIAMLFACTAGGCRTMGGSPFAFGNAGSSAVVQNQAEPASRPAIAPPTSTAPGNDAIAQQIAAESRALSGSYSVESNQELEKYASMPESTVGYTSVGSSGESSAGGVSPSGSFGSGPASSSSGCSSGCCH